jgi:ABC-type branched-subunit amino acid transport system substrate-binding protein
MVLSRRGIVLAGLIVVAALALSAATTGHAASKTVVVYAFDDTGAAGTGNVTPYDGAAAAAKSINAKGGLSGYQIAVKRCSTKTDVNVARTCGQKATSDKNAIAVISLSQIGSPVYGPILTQGKLPLVNVFGGGVDGTSPISFPLDGAGFQLLGSLGYAYNKLGLKKIYMVLGDFGQASDLFVGLADTIMKTSTKGVGLSGSVKIPPSATDVTPYVQQALNSKADAIGAFLFEPTFIQFYRAYKQAGGTTPVFCGGCGGAIPQLGKLADGVLPVLNALPPTAKSKAVTQFVSDMTKYGPKRKGILDESATTFGWSAMKLIQTALKGSTTVNRAQTLKKLGSLNNAPAGLYANFTTTKPFTGLGGSQPRIFNTTVMIGVARDGKIYAKTGFFNWNS